METTGVGGGIMLAIAALLWMAYLLPHWFKRQQYLATERNAVRLQQTVRVLAETAEMPDVVRAGMFPQRSTALPGPHAVSASMTGDAHEQLARPVSATAHASARQAGPRVPAGTPRAVRLRRTRAATSLVLFASLAVLGVQSWLIATTGAVVGSWIVVSLGAVLAIGSIGMLGQLARVGPVRRQSVAAPLRKSIEYSAEPVAAPQPKAEWTPVPVPKPLYLSRSEPQRAARTDVAGELEAAAIAAERALREAQRAPGVRTIERPSAAPVPAAAVPAAAPVPASAHASAKAGASAFASMGIVDAPAADRPDLDAVLRRRRAG